MTLEIVIVTAILITALVLLITERLPYDLTAIAIMVALMVTGLLTPRQAVAGFANPAPLTVGALFIVSRALVRTGSLVFLTRLVAGLTRGQPRLILLVSLVLVGVLSAFVNNTPVVVLMLTVILAICGRFKLSPARFLMPISFVSILAGTTTLIGTSTNIIVSDLAAARGLAPLRMFELAHVGLPVAVIGAILLFALTDRLMPRTHTPILHHDGGAEHKYIAELAIPDSSPLVGREVLAALQNHHPDVEVHEVLRQSRIFYPETDPCTLAGGDIVLLSATASELVELLGGTDVTLPVMAGKSMPLPYEKGGQLVEAIVPPDSHLLGRRIADTFLGAGEAIMVVGAQRRRVHYAESKMSDLRLHIGDILLIQCGDSCLRRLRTESDLIIVEASVPQIVNRGSRARSELVIINRRRAPLALAIFVAMVTVAAFGFADILTTVLAAAFLMLITGCLNLHEAYEAIDVPVLMLIIGTIALGAAMTTTGAAELYARTFLNIFHGAGPHTVLVAFIILTSVLSHVLSNNSTAVLLVPIGIATAAALEVDPRPFVVGICFGASACFASPIGYQTNLLIYGPGGYRFGDFVRLGMVLNLVVWITASVLIPRYWAF